MSLPSSMADFVPGDRLLQKAYYSEQKHMKSISGHFHVRILFIHRLKTTFAKHNTRKVLLSIAFIQMITI